MTVKTHVYFILDDSASMSPIATFAQKAFNTVFDAIKEDAIQNPSDVTLLSLRTFGQRIDTPKFYGVSAQFTKGLETYAPRQGLTRLFEAVGTTIEELENNETDPEFSYLILVVTDGQNNHAGYSVERLKKTIARVQKTERWTVAFQVPPGSKRSLVAYGIPEGNVTEWEQTAEGVEYAGVVTTASTSAYLDSRRSGQTATRSFYVADTSNLNKKVLAQNFQDVRSLVKVFGVHVDERIDSFFSLKAGEFVLGNGFYELTKSEDVQPQKKLLVRDRKTGAIYTGKDVRSLLGLPDNVKIKLRPDKNGRYDIFVQSTAPNRKLLGGTTVIYVPRQFQYLLSQ